jgi:protein ImuB
MFACLHGAVAGLAGIAAAFAPEYEQTSSDTVVFAVDALRRMYGVPSQIAQAIASRAGSGVNVALADTVDTAILAARNCPGVSVRPNLARLPVDRLPFPEGTMRAQADEMLDVLESWGIHTFEQLAELPEAGIAERFGVQGVQLQRLVRGAVDRPLRIYRPETEYADRIEWEHPVALLEPLLFLIARVLNEQCARLNSNALATNEVHLVLELEDRTEHARSLHLPMALHDSQTLLKLLQLDLEAHPPHGPAMALRLALTAVPPRTIQNGIFQPLTPAPDRLELTLARIRALVGEENAGIPELLDTHHPHPFRLVREFPHRNGSPPLRICQAFRFFRPPLCATVDLLADRPRRLQSTGISGVIAVAAGPWRSSGNWWTAENNWNRDEWDVSLSNGALYRIYCELAGRDKRWFVEGSYD